ncbi:hypothetical protein IPA_03750 [Ignicoccus pacificus DSM 13166]|uniref:Uncharacterized protein n=1 Tax=Ignicoccus pacificus DSM 13166 TaxID=940294 RepID=A0A977KB14_9CREN|nr:hypothetical protein IPA_03750 [Ignicoccus pacificus DSM 13166]
MKRWVALLCLLVPVLANTYYILVTYSPIVLSVGYLELHVVGRDFPVFSNSTYWSTSMTLEVRGFPLQTTVSLSTTQVPVSEYEVSISAIFKDLSETYVATTATPFSEGKPLTLTLRFEQYVPLVALTSTKVLGEVIMTIAPAGVYVVPLPLVLVALAPLVVAVSRRRSKKGLLILIGPSDLLMLGIALVVLSAIELLLLAIAFYAGLSFCGHKLPFV